MADKNFEEDRSFVLLSHPLSPSGGRVYRESLLETIPQVVNNPGARLAFQIYDVIFLCVTDPTGISTAIDRVYTHRACTQRCLRVASQSEQKTRLFLSRKRNDLEIILGTCFEAVIHSHITKYKKIIEYEHCQ